MSKNIFFHRFQEEYCAVLNNKIFTVSGIYKGHDFKEEISFPDNMQVHKGDVLRKIRKRVKKKFWKLINKHEAICP